MKIGDNVYVHGYVDEIRKGTVIIRNAGGYFGTIPKEIICGEMPEQKTGKWIEVEVFPESYDIYGNKTWSSEMQCDQCGFRHTAIEGHMAQYNFCPNCGARIQEGEKHETD